MKKARRKLPWWVKLMRYFARTIVILCAMFCGLSASGADKTQDVDALIQQLETGTDREREEAAEKLGDLGDNSAVEPLIRALEDKRAEVRWEASAALEAIADPRAFEPLIPLTQDKDWHVRANARDALLAIDGSRAIPYLIEGMSDENFHCKYHAAEGFKFITDTEAVSVLVTELDNKNAEMRRLAAVALGEIGDTSAVGPLIVALGEEEWKVRSSVTGALGNIGDERAFEPLVDAALNDGNFGVRGNAVDALATIGEERATETLIAALDDRSWFVRAKTAWNLGYYGDERGIEPLRKLYYRKKGTIIARLNPYSDCGAAMRSLGMLGDTSMVEEFIDLVGKGRLFLGMYAAMALGEMGDARAVQPLIKGMNSKGIFFAKGLKWTCIEALGEISDTSAVPALIETLSDEDYGNDAAVALGKIGDPRAVEPLIALLAHEEYYFRRDAAWALAEIANEAAVEALLDCLARKDEVAVAGAHCFFIKRGEPETEDILLSALNEYGNSEMAQNYGCCGNHRLEEAGRKWAQLKFRTIEENPDAPRWGGVKQGE